MGIAYPRRSAHVAGLGAMALLCGACSALPAAPPKPVLPQTAPTHATDRPPPPPARTPAPSAASDPSPPAEAESADLSSQEVRIARVVVISCKHGESDPRCQARAKEQALAEAGAGAEWVATTMGEATTAYVFEVELDGAVDRFTAPDLETITRRLTELARAGRRVKLLRSERVPSGGRLAKIMLTVPAR